MTEYGSIMSTKRDWIVLRCTVGARPNPLPAKQKVLTFHSVVVSGAVTRTLLLLLELRGREHLHEEIHPTPQQWGVLMALNDQDYAGPQA